MALLRQCLQELRLRRGDMDILFETSKPINVSGRMAVPRVIADGGIDTEQPRMRSDVISARASHASAAGPAWR